MLKQGISIIFGILLSGLVTAQDVNKIFNDRIEIYFSFETLSREEVNTLSKIISIDNVNEHLQVFAYANMKEFTNFLEYNIDYEIQPHPGTLIDPPMLEEIDIKDIASWNFYPTYEAYVDMMYQFESDYPDLCDVYSIGTTNNGREILVARITDNVDTMEGEPEFLYTSSMHGDETTGYVLMLRLMDYLLTNYGSNPRITNMLDEIDIYINPLANPDGTYYTGNHTVNGAIRGNGYGINLNRNYPDPQDGPHPDGNAWQTETLHFMDFAEEHNFVMGANFHGGTEVLNYPWDTWAKLAADNNWWVHICREIADTVHEHAPDTYLEGFNNGITNGYQWYTIAGGRQDYMNYFQQCREFTWEISDVKLLPPSQLPAHWDYNYRSFLNHIEQALYGVRGTITDSATGDPLKAEVFVLNHELDSSWVYSSMPAGNYHRPIFMGTYDFKFLKNGYISQTFEDVEIENWETVVIDVELVTAFSDVEELPNTRFSVYPNPATANFVKLNMRSGIDNIKVYSLNGELTYQTNAGGNQLEFLDVSMLSPGTYIIQVESEGKTYRQKLIRQ